MILHDKQILQIALPSIVSNITVPLLGLVDLAIVGHLEAASYIGAIAVGSMLFNIIYWIFGFLRMGTSGLTSQAFGQRNLPEATRLLIRSVGIGILVACCLILFQIPIRNIAISLIQPTEEVRHWATIYFHICIWGAPAILGLYGLTGWYIGMQNSRIPLWIAITQNVVNIIASLCFVFIGGMKVEGIALGTLVAQYTGFFMAIGLWIRYYGKLKSYIQLQTDTGLWNRVSMARFFQVNRDIFLRTLCLVAVTLFFTSAGAAQGEIILAVNTLLMQLFTLFSYIMDGFAYAGEALSGKYIGAKNEPAFRITVRRLFLWGGGMTLLFTGLYAVGGTAFLQLLTDNTTVLAAADPYFYWVLAIPIAGVAAFIWDGIFIGATATREMLISMILATLFFFAVYYNGHPLWGNHALWLAFISYLSIRGITQSFLFRRITFHRFL